MNRVLKAECCLSATIYIIFVLLVPLVQTKDLTEFHLNGSVYCNIFKSEFRYRIVIVEEDELKMDNVIDQRGVILSRSYIHDVEMKGTQNGDCFLFFCDEFYEVVTYIYHDCSTDGVLRRIRDPWQENIPVTSKHVTRHMIINLTDDGERVTSFFEDK